MQRLEILDAIVAGIDRRQELLQIVSAAPSDEEARRQLGAAFGFNEGQAAAVLDIQVRRFATEQRRRISNERDQLQRSIGLV